MATPLEHIHPRNLKHLADRLQGLVRTRLWAQVLVGMALGIAVGIAIGPSFGWLAPRTAYVVGEWLALPGLLFLALIQMIVVPLVLSAIVCGIAATADPGQLRRGGLWLACASFHRCGRTRKRSRRPQADMKKGPGERTPEP